MFGSVEGRATSIGRVKSSESKIIATCSIGVAKSQGIVNNLEIFKWIPFKS